MTKILNQKPIEIDAQFKYRCPVCASEHWISIKQARVKNFKIVCDCDTVFQPKRIKKIVAVYVNPNKPATITSSGNKTDTVSKCSTDIKPVEINTDLSTKKTTTLVPLDNDILNKCIKLLIGYGFTLSESKDLVLKSYDRLESKDIGQLVKNVLENIGDK